MTGTSNNLDFSLKMLLAFEVAFYIFLKEVSLVIDSVGKSMIKSVSTPIAKGTVIL